MLLLLLVSACSTPTHTTEDNDDAPNPNAAPAVEEQAVDLGCGSAGVLTAYFDRDGDLGFSDEPETLCRAAAPTVHSEVVGTDCDDTDPSIFTGAPEVCDDIDQDCDGRTNDGLESGQADEDGDGYASPWAPQIFGCPQDPGWTAHGGDCDDTDPDRFPNAVEDCGDGVDQDCDGTVDCEDANCAVATQCFEGDCDDDDDGDNDGLTDCLDDDCWGNSGCDVSVALTITGGAMERRHQTHWNTWSSVFINGTYPNSTLTFGFNSVRDVDVSLRADLSGTAVITTTQGDAATCAFSDGAGRWGAGRHCVNAPCPQPTSLAIAPGGAGACRLGDLLPSTLNAVGDGVYTVDGAEWMRADISSTTASWNWSYSSETRRGAILPGEPIVTGL